MKLNFFKNNICDLERKIPQFQYFQVFNKFSNNVGSEKHADTTRYCIRMVDSRGYSWWEWRTSKPTSELSCSDGYDNDCDGLTDCADTDCVGKTGPNGVICCQSNDDCSSVSCSGGFAAYCDLSSHKCKCRTSCTDNSHCVKDKCCTDDPNGPQTGELKCVDKGKVINSGGKSYLCDPPGWGSSKQSTSEESKPTIFDLILNYFQNIFS